MAKKITGVSVGKSYIRAVELTVSGKDAKVSAFIDHPADEPEKEEILKKLALEKKIEYRNTVTGIGSEKLFFRETVFPFDDKKRIAQTLPYSLTDTLPFSLKDAVFSYYEPVKGTEKTGVVSIIAKKETVDEIKETFSEAGIALSAISAECEALARVLHPGEPSEKSFILFHIGTHKATVNFIKEWKVAYSRIIGPGVEDILSELAAGLQIDVNAAETILFSGISRADKENIEKAEKIVKEILGRFIKEIEISVKSHCKSAEAISTITFSGEGAVIKGLPEYLEKELGLKATPAEIGEGVNVESGIDKKELLNKGAEALGYAIMGLKGCRINFLGDKNRLLDSPFIKMLHAQKRLLAAGFALLLLLYTVNLSVTVAAYGKRYDALKEKITQTFRSALPEIKRIVNEKHQLKTALDELENKIEILSDKGSTKVVDLLREISIRAPENVPLRITRLRIGKDTVRIEGETSNFDGVEKIKSALGKASVFETVEVVGAKASRLQNVIEFQLNLKLSEL